MAVTALFTAASFTFASAAAVGGGADAVLDGGASPLSGATTSISLSPLLTLLLCRRFCLR
jgi:hypothetical protein